MFRARKHEVGDNPLSKPILVETLGSPVPLSESQMLEFLGTFISEREKYISDQQEQIYSEQKHEEDGEEEASEEKPEAMSTTNAKISQISSANQYISQLNRMERSLKGFAPSIVEQVNNNKKDVSKDEKQKPTKITFDETKEEETTANANGDKVGKTKTGGKKITFD